MSGLTFAVTLDVDVPATREALASICELMSQDIGAKVEPLVAPGPADLARALAVGEASFAWLSPTLLLMTPELHTSVPLLSTVREGRAVFHSVIFASLTSRITKLTELDRAHAAWVAPTSASGYLVPRLTLVKEGVSLTRAVGKESFHNTHAAVAKAVLGGKADIGATFAHFEKGDASLPMIRSGYQEASPFARARILAVSGAIPADMVVAHAGVSIADRVAVAGALCRLVHDPVGSEPFRMVIGAEDFRAVSHESLDDLQRLMEAAIRTTV